MKPTYEGDSWGKKFVRAQVYLAIRKAWRSARPEGEALFLAGPEAAEVAIARDVLGLRAEQCLFVDDVAENLTRIDWPGARVLAAKASRVIKGLGTAALLMLDYCGTAQNAVEDLRLAAPKLAQHGVLTVTYLRGRDSGADDTARQEALAAVCNAAPDMFPFMVCRYTSRHGPSVQPMCLIAWMRGGKAKAPKISTVTDTKKDPAQARVRHLALSEMWRGVPICASLLNLPPSTLIAWKAHSTRGTYV
jgi:hypothetical protein